MCGFRNGMGQNPRLAALFEQKLTGLHSSLVASCGSPPYPPRCRSPRNGGLYLIYIGAAKAFVLVGVGKDIHDGKNKPPRIFRTTT